MAPKSTDICRLCAKKTEDVMAIYSKDGRLKDMEQKINLYLPIKVSENDDLPLQCCSTCTSTILAWHDLFIICIEVDHRLRSNKLNMVIHDAFDGIEGDEDSDSEKFLETVYTSDSLKYSENMESTIKPNIKEKKHSDSVIEEKSNLAFNCYNCDERFVSKRNLILHLNRKHKNVSSKFLKNHDPSTLNKVKYQNLHVNHLKKENISEIISKLSSNSVTNMSFPCQIKAEPSVIKRNEHSDKIIIDHYTEKEKDELKYEQLKITKSIIMKFEEKVDESPSLCEHENKKLSKEDIEKLIDPMMKTCKMCLMQFGMKIDLKRHLLSVHNIKEQKLRRKHSEIEATFFCDVCDKGFTRKYDMLKHRKSRHKEVQDNLNVESSARKQLVKQSKIKGEDGKSAYKCDFCSHIFKLSDNLIQHRRIHTGEKPYFCDLCGKNFSSKTGLNRHVNEFHQCIKKYKCDVCDKMFKTRSTKDDHMNIHTDTRPYVCDICGKAYRQKASLHVHKIYHTNNFRFSCDICGTKYRRAQELKVHNRIHTGDKPYKCYICTSHFRWKYDLKRHMKTHSAKLK